MKLEERYIRDATGQVIGYALDDRGNPPRQIRKGGGPVFNIGPLLRFRVKVKVNTWKGFRTEKEKWVERYYRISVPAHGDLPIRDPDNPPKLRMYQGTDPRGKGKRMMVHTYTDPLEEYRAKVVGEGRGSGALVYMNSKGQLRVNQEVWQEKGLVGIPIDVEYKVDLMTGEDTEPEAVEPEAVEAYTYKPKRDEEEKSRVSVEDKEKGIQRQLETALTKRRRGKELTEYEAGLVDMEALKEQYRQDMEADPSLKEVREGFLKKVGGDAE